MNYTKKIIVGIAVSLFLFSCTEHEMKDFTVDKPQSIIDNEYLNEYDVLKNYVNRAENPNFKLGIGASLSDYVNKGLVYRLINSNFDEMTMGWEMKHGAIVKSDGSLDLANVENLIDVAKSAGVTIYGHTLCWHANQNADYLNNIISPTIIPGEGGEAGYCYTFTNPSATSYWSAQVVYDLASTLENGAEYTLKFAVRGSAAGVIRPEVQTTSDYSSNGFGSVNVTTTWTEHELKATMSAGTRNRFVISFGEFEGTVYLDNVTLRKTGTSTDLILGGDFENGANGWSGWGNSSTRGLSSYGEGYSAGEQIVEKTDEEKRDIIYNALETWMAGMLGVCKSYVTAWDVVNEPMSDWPDPSVIKTGVGKTDMTADEFYWQDYLGKDYAAIAIQLARKYGNTSDKLFINDYGLENADQKKCRGLIDFVAYTESKGVVVDGIGTQMHVTCGETTMQGIRDMFTNLAATGKLIKVSELDMGYRVAASSTNLKTSEMTVAQKREMSEFYEAIVKAYFEIIPAAQRYGITQWCITDSPSNSSWRADEPVGLWTLDNVRKPAYGGFANGLAGRKIVEPTSN